MVPAVRVQLVGEISENCDFAQLLGECGSTDVILDLAEVRRINSCGVREWINFVRALDDPAVCWCWSVAQSPSCSSST